MSARHRSAPRSCSHVRAAGPDLPARRGLGIVTGPGGHPRVRGALESDSGLYKRGRKSGERSGLGRVRPLSIFSTRSVPVFTCLVVLADARSYCKRREPAGVRQSSGSLPQKVSVGPGFPVSGGCGLYLTPGAAVPPSGGGNLLEVSVGAHPFYMRPGLCLSFSLSIYTLGHLQFLLTYSPAERRGLWRLLNCAFFAVLVPGPAS